VERPHEKEDSTAFFERNTAGTCGTGVLRSQESACPLGPYARENASLQLAGVQLNGVRTGAG
jgi:hypothetical protein